MPFTVSIDRDPRVVVAGGGVAALEAVLALRNIVDDPLEIELVAPSSSFDYRPLSVLEPFGLGRRWRMPLDRFAADQNAALRRGTVRSVDPERHRLVTDAGDVVEYDLLLVAVGARTRPSVSGAVTYRGPADTARLRRVLDAARDDPGQRLAFALPDGVAWSLPLYELALMSAVRLSTGEADRPHPITLVTPERAPLELFGAAASAKVRALLEERGVRLVSEREAVSVRRGRLRLRPEGEVEADRVVALPRLEGPGIDGLPADSRRFIPTDAHGRVTGVEDVFAAGDATTFPVKQGGIATQQADAAAEAIAARLGLPVEPRPCRPVLRGMLLTGSAPMFLRAVESGGDEPQPSPLWWPPTKIAGRHLPAYLAIEERAPTPADVPHPAPGMPIEVDLEAMLHSPGSPPRPAATAG